MISLKKSYARQLLQLALTLSLLRVDPESYLGWGWESQLALQNGDGWQLELRAAPLSDYPYSNRKALIPLIEDLVRFDRQTNPSTYDVQTYLLNVQNEQISSAMPTATPSPTIQTIDSNATLPVQQQPIVSTQSMMRNTTEFTVPINPELADLFLLNADPFGENVSVLDQNLADLNDYEEGARNDPFLNFHQLYAGLPLKDEPPEIFDDHSYNIRFGDSDIDEQQLATSVPTVASTSSDYGSMGRAEIYGMLRNTESPTINLTRVIEWSNYFENYTKSEIKDEEDETVVGDISNEGEQNTTKKLNNLNNSKRIKLESEGDDSTSGFSSNVELTEEVIK